MSVAQRFEEFQRVDRQLGDLANELKIEPIDPRGDLGLEPAASAGAARTRVTTAREGDEGRCPSCSAR
jgi:hypothetical protein